MSEWKPLSVRTGVREDSGPFEGVPPHMLQPVHGWLSYALGSRNDRVQTLANAVRVPLPINYADYLFRAYWARIEGSEESILDTVDALLKMAPDVYEGFEKWAEKLENILLAGGSVWTVNTDLDGLERRVAQTSSDAFQQAVAPGDDAAEELSTAWALAYGRNPDPSDAWDHAIKAVEATLIPIVVPNKAKATLGDVAGVLKSTPSSWSFGLPGAPGHENGAALEALIRHIWPNPDRHGGGSNTRVPSQTEAESVVQIAVLLVNLCRGRLIKL